MKYKCYLNYFSKAALVVNILKTATTTYLGKQVSYRKETEQPFRLWYNRLFGVFLFCKHIKKYSIVNFQVAALVENVFLLGVLKITKWFLFSLPVTWHFLPTYDPETFLLPYK